MMTFLLFAPARTKWLGWRKDRKSRRDRSGRFCDIHCAVILRYSFALRSDILWSSRKDVVLEIVLLRRKVNMMGKIFSSSFVRDCSLSLPERWTIREIRWQPNSVLTYSLFTDVLGNPSSTFWFAGLYNQWNGDPNWTAKIQPYGPQKSINDHRRRERSCSSPEKGVHVIIMFPFSVSIVFLNVR